MKLRRRLWRNRRRQRGHVRYFTPFAHPGEMPRRAAKRRLKDETRLWEQFEQAGRLTPELLQLGPPRIERRH